MSETVNIWEKPKAKEIYMLAGWRQWADAGSISSGLPLYLVQDTKARRIGEMKSDGFYLFQIPGTHDLVRPVVRFEDGYPESMDAPLNEFYYTGNEERGVVIFLGDEPHLDAERYIGALLDTAQELGVKRIIGLGGVYGELPYNKERMVSSTYSLPGIKEEMDEMAVTLSDYHGGASIGTYLCKRAGERGVEYVSFYAFVPTYDFSGMQELGNGIRIENDFMAWLGVMKRVNHMIKTDFDLTDLEERTQHLLDLMDSKVDELEKSDPESGIRDLMNQIEQDFTEVVFNPLADVWELELRRLLDEDEDNNAVEDEDDAEEEGTGQASDEETSTDEE